MSTDTERKTFAQREHDILRFWNEQKIFEKSLKQRLHAQVYTFFDGPPFATGLPHYGHLLAGTIKDVVCRIMTMKGFFVPRRFGWDCHGLPVESLVEKKQGLSGGASIRQYGIDKFNETCRDNVLTYTQQWRVTVERLGRWIDMDHGYKTMDRNYMESVWWVFKSLYDKGLVYQGYKVMPFSWKLGTPLSNFEASDNYQNVDDPSLVVAFEDKTDSELFYLAWTTTPWTLISNLALVVGPDIEYVQVLWQGKKWILAKDRLEDVFKDKVYEIEKSFLGSDLSQRLYKPLFKDFESYSEQGAFRILSASFVSTSDGTGIVHAAPAFGENDFEVCKTHQVPLVCPINENGLFTSEVARYQGRLWMDCNKEIIREIKEKGQLFSQATINHRYPFCYRTDTPLIYRVTDTWFIAVEKIKDRLVHHNRSIKWVPEHIRDGRFGKWLEGAKDWSVSRNRFWGTPIPIWQSEAGDILVVGSLEELKELTGAQVDDLHRHFIDTLTIEKNGKSYKRIDAVFDCWFESGSMPYAQNHYPFKQVNETLLSADFIAEGLDQTRGWFYTLHVLAVALFDRPAFRQVIVNGIVLAQDGTKMSKRLQNYPDPSRLLEQYGSDALRLYLLKSPVVRAEDLAFQETGVDSIVKQVLLPWWNAYSFFNTYAKIYHWDPSQAKALDDEALTSLDKWILSRLQTLIRTIDEGMAHYHLWEAIEALIHFIEDLTNWYIRRSRSRFWSEENLPDRAAAMHTLYHVLLTLCKVASPFAPFLSEGIYQKLKGVGSPLSVHLCDWPHVMNSRRDAHLEKVMAAIAQLSSMGHGLRKDHRLKVRQPLAKAWIADASGALGEGLMEYAGLLADEINVKAIELKLHTHELLRITYKPNFKTLGPRVGKKMKALQAFMSTMSDEQHRLLEKEGCLKIDLEGESFELLRPDVEAVHHLLPGQVAACMGGLAICLDTALNEELLLEGMARELVNKVNTLRKEKAFEISDRIHLKLGTQAVDTLNHMLQKHQHYLSEQTLSSQIELDAAFTSETTCDLGNLVVHFAIERVNVI